MYIYIYNNVKITQNNFVADLKYLKIMDNVYILDSKSSYYDFDLYEGMNMSVFLDNLETELEYEDVDININEILKDKDTSKGILIYSNSVADHKIVKDIMNKMNFHEIEELTKNDSIYVKTYWVH